MIGKVKITSEPYDDSRSIALRCLAGLELVGSCFPSVVASDAEQVQARGDVAAQIIAAENAIHRYLLARKEWLAAESAKKKGK